LIWFRYNSRILSFEYRCSICLATFASLTLRTRSLLAGDALGKDVSRELHRDGGEALLPRTRAEVAERGAGYANPVDAGVLVEALVLGEDERVLHHFRDLRDLHERTALEPDLGDKASVGGVDLEVWRGV
jgi:hypothetical protein